MNKLIDADTLYQSFLDLQERLKNRYIDIDDIYHVIQEAQPVDLSKIYSPNKLGKWIHIRSDIYECSICGHIHTSFELNRCDAKYCPNCGEKMEVQ